MGFFSGKGVHIGWDEESYPQYQDLIALPFFTVSFLLLRLILDRFIFEKLATRLIFGKDHAKLKTSLRRKKITKFKECAWKTFYGISAEFLAILVTYNEPWFSNTRYFWIGPGDQVWPDQKMKFKLKLLYMYSGGFYIYAIVALLFWDTKRSDFWASMIHHVASVLLIAVSYIFRFGRVGSVVLALHEASDVFLETAKMSKYSGYDRLANTLFPIFALSWLIFRLILFPFWVLRSTSYEILYILDGINNTEGTVLYYFFNSLLFCLLALHWYWGKLALKMAVEQIKSKGQVSDDVRSDSEGEEEHQD
ncbi:ASC1-like protein 1 [Coffea eugenioides]|uniref:ASC1-like protein 1 n=1 Tax=Coffea arabica TaxID=13443 RepID=A0A6P6XEJ5_COFAR|nr:ASC1-like protein 1 [Coffea arabica]XP_027168122.1 ASC1-like protein 1 [Coffea eugenioides]